MDGINPFNVYDSNFDKNKSVAIITRATLNFTKLIEFWNSVPKASNAIKNAKEFYGLKVLVSFLLFSKLLLVFGKI